MTRGLGKEIKYFIMLEVKIKERLHDSELGNLAFVRTFIYLWFLNLLSGW